MAATSKKDSSNKDEQASISLGNLAPAEGATKAKLRVGRGRASGAGKTCNRGHNGEGQRSGRPRKIGFEGGQMPGYRRAPKIRGFQLVNKRNWLEINVKDLEKILKPEDKELTYELLQERGLLKRTMDGVRLLGNGEVSRGVKVHVHHATEGARKKVEAAGGSITIVEPAKAATAD
ncbi:MAG: 50S ribosomal protein L15 [Vampirovibrio sp.]|nr:50S ribosomal protein L15 [Vampirovibrio sp.]